jgi:hypothetical protein
MTAEDPRPLDLLLGFARTLIEAARHGGSVPPFDELVDRASAGLLTAMAFRDIARDLDLRGLATAAAAIDGLAAAARAGADPEAVAAALDAIEDLLTRTAARSESAR